METIEMTKKQEETGPPNVRSTSKQTIEIDRQGLIRVKGLCTTRGWSFQQFAIYGINLALIEAGQEPIEEEGK